MDPSRRPGPRQYPHSPRHRPSFHPRDHRLARDEQSYRPGPKAPSSQLPVPLLTNAYRLGLSKPGIKVHEYELRIATSVGCKNLSPDVLCRNFVSRSIRELLMNNIVPKLVNNRESLQSVVIEFNLKAIYSIEPFKTLSSSSGSKSQLAKSDRKYIFENIAVMTDLLTKLNVDIELTYSRSIPLDTSECDINLMMSILNHQLLLNLLRFGSVYYLSHDQEQATPRGDGVRLDLISKHVMGISLSGIRRCSLDKSFVVVSCTHSYITLSNRLIDLLATFLFDRPCIDPEYEKLVQVESIDADNIGIFSSILNGFKCQTIGMSKRINLRFCLTEEPARSINWSTDPMDSLTVHQFYRHNNINLKYPNLPCLKSRDPAYPYIPLEMCQLIPDQKVPIFRLSSNARNHLIQLNKPKPDVFKQSSAKARDRIACDNNRQFRSFGLDLGSMPLRTEGSLLQKPILKYRNSLIEPRKDFWESEAFSEVVHLIDNWCVVDTVGLRLQDKNTFFSSFSEYCTRVGFNLGRPHYTEKLKQSILDSPSCLDSIVDECKKLTQGRLRFLMFIIDSSSTALNRLIHLTFDERPRITAACLRADSVLNRRQHRSIFRTLIHKLNARLGGTNFTFHEHSLAKMSLTCQDLMIIGLDVTHPDNELSGVSIVGCAYTYSSDLFRHRSLVWPQTARVEIIGKMDQLIDRLLKEYYKENKNQLPRQIIIYRDGVSHEEFDKVRDNEVLKVLKVLETISLEKKCQRPELSFIIAQKRHTMRFFQTHQDNVVSNPPGGTLIDQDVVMPNGREFYLFANTSPQATARPIHYHVLTNGLGIDNLQKLTYYLCFNFGKCSGTLSMPSSLRYAHNAAYDARNRVIASREFSENKFYISRFFC